MFKNIGRKIKGLAKVIFVISVVLCVIGALVAAIGVGVGAAQSCGSYRSSSGAAGFFAGLGTFIVIAGFGFLFSWIGSFFTYGLGQLIDDTENNRKTNEQILAKLQSAPVQNAPAAPKAAPVPPVAPQQPAQWVCPNCRSTNDAAATFCTNCGTRKA